MPSDVEYHGVVVAVTVVVGVVDRTEAGIKPRSAGNPRGWAIVHLVDQVPREGVDVYSVGDVADRVAVADHVVGMGSVIADTGLEVVSDLPLQGSGPDVRFWGFQVRVDATNTESGSYHASLRVKPTSCLWRGTRPRPKRREGKPERGLAAVPKHKNGSLCARCPSRDKGRINLSRRAAAE